MSQQTKSICLRVEMEKVFLIHKMQRLNTDTKQNRLPNSPEKNGAGTYSFSL